MKHWFDIDLDWIKYNFMTREPEFLMRPFQRNIQGQARKKLPTFTVLIGISKETGEMEFYSFLTILEYQKNDLNSRCFSH